MKRETGHGKISVYMEAGNHTGRTECLKGSRQSQEGKWMSVWRQAIILRELGVYTGLGNHIGGSG
jgi:hypothetical protein